MVFLESFWDAFEEDEAIGGGIEGLSDDRPEAQL